MMPDRRLIAGLCLSAAGFVGLLGYEGYSDRAIIPVKGDVPTIGFGTTEGVRLGDSITPPKALERALRDSAKYENAIRQCVDVPLYQYEYDAYVSLIYNIGPGAFCSSTLVAKLNDYKYREACQEILRWDKFRGQPLPGLTTRRQKEYRTCLGLA